MVYSSGASKNRLVNQQASAKFRPRSGREADGAEDHGFMYSRSFYDLDGHGWQVMWMDPAAVPGDEASAAAAEGVAAPA